MSVLGSIKDRDELVRRLAVTAAVLVVYRLGSHIPLPGLDAHAIAQVLPSGGEAVGRVSILALGIIPLFTVVLFVELAKVVAPRLRQWERAEERNRDRLARLVVLLAMMTALVQAVGYVHALEGVATLVAEPGLDFRFAGAATIVAGSALAILLADTISRHGIGSGLWLLLVVPTLAELPARSAAMVELYAQGMLSPGALIVCAACIAVPLILIVTLLQAERGSLPLAQTTMWSALLTYAVLPWLIVIGGILTVGLGEDAAAWLSPVHPAHTFGLAALVAVVPWLYVRSLRRAGAPEPGLAPVLVALTLLGALVVAESVPGALGVPMPISGQACVVIAVVAIVSLDRWWEPPWAASGPQSSGMNR